MGKPEISPLGVKGLKEQGTFRKGGLLASFFLKKGTVGITLGRNMTLFKQETEQSTYAHEWYHGYQISDMGVYNFYFQILTEYLLYGYDKSELEKKAFFFEKNY